VIRADPHPLRREAARREVAAICMGPVIAASLGVPDGRHDERESEEEGAGSGIRHAAGASRPTDGGVRRHGRRAIEPDGDRTHRRQCGRRSRRRSGARRRRHRFELSRGPDGALRDRSTARRGSSNTPRRRSVGLPIWAVPIGPKSFSKIRIDRESIPGRRPAESTTTRAAFVTQRHRDEPRCRSNSPGSSAPMRRRTGSMVRPEGTRLARKLSDGFRSRGPSTSADHSAGRRRRRRRSDGGPTRARRSTRSAASTGPLYAEARRRGGGGLHDAQPISCRASSRRSSRRTGSPRPNRSEDVARSS